MCATVGPAGTARAETNQHAPETTTPAHRLRWQWRRAGIVDYAATAALGVGALAIAFGTDQSEDPAWTGPALFDRGAHDALVGRSPTSRNRADTASNYLAVAPSVVTVGTSLLIPLLGDRSNTEVAWQLTVINLQSSALNQLLTLGGKRIIRRERPDVADCREDPNHSDKCFVTPTESMPSGHSSTAFVGAGLGCTQHLMLGLIGEPVLDASVCALLLATASTSGVLRVAADRHYLTDVVAGAKVGLTAGVAMPLSLHYRSRSGSSEEASTSHSSLRWTVTPLVGANRAGIGLYGWF
jgi:membrane-associated phospholipid phosphatase